VANKKYNWEEPQKHFLQSSMRSGISLKTISEQFRIPYQSVRRYAAAHKWHRKRYHICFGKEHGMTFEEHLKQLYREAMNKK
jgi:hypothetical protein